MGITGASHGGVDSGAVGNNLKEKDLTLLISKEMYRLFKERGIPVYLTRDDDSTLSPSERVKKTLSFFGNSKDVIVISNHINAGGGEGSEVIYSLRNNSQLSNKILNNLEKSGAKIRRSFQKSSTTNPLKDYYFMLRDTANTESIIVEYGFIDNASDAKKLAINYKDYAKDVVDAVLDYTGYIVEPDEYYIVKSGDTLYSIARRFNISVDEIKQLNNLYNNTLSIGQKLYLFKPIEEDYYVVKKGDTLYGIANKYNISVDKLKEINNLSNNSLSIGQKLYIANQNNDMEEMYPLNEYYVVQPGDTLYSIAKLNNTTVDNLKKINNLNNNVLSIGQKLFLPEKEYYVVKSGDTLYGIAKKYNTTVGELASKNNLTSSTLNIGQKLII